MKIDWEYRQWGSFQVLFAQPNFVVKRLMVAPGGSLSLQYHRYRAERWMLASSPVSGMTFEIAGRRASPRANTLYTIEPLTTHRIINESSLMLKIIEISTGYVDEEDIVRLEDKYGRV